MSNNTTLVHLPRSGNDTYCHQHLDNPKHFIAPFNAITGAYTRRAPMDICRDCVNTRDKEEHARREAEHQRIQQQESDIIARHTGKRGLVGEDLPASIAEAHRRGEDTDPWVKALIEIDDWKLKRAGLSSWNESTNEDEQ